MGGPARDERLSKPRSKGYGSTLNGAGWFIEPRAAISSDIEERGRHCKSLESSIDNVIVYRDVYRGFLKSRRIPCAIFQCRDCRRNRANNEPSSPRCLITTTIITPDTTAADRAACDKK
jgi:hypothetical protein